MSQKLRWAGAVAAILAAVLIVAFWPAEEPPVTEPIRQDRYIPPAPEALALPPISFVDVTAGSGIDFRHVTGGFMSDDGTPSRYLPECMGPGVVLFDPDGDGDLDLFVANGCAFPGRPRSEPPATARLYRNDGAMRFADITEASGLAITCYGMGGAAADLDADGDQDLLVTSWGGARLFRNDRKPGTDGPGFTEVTGDAGLVTEGWTDARGRKGPDWSTSAAIFDADEDGDLDLFVCNYVQWTPETDVFTTIDGKHKSFTIPDRYHGNSCRLFRNDGALRFADVTKEAGILDEEGKSLGVSILDYDDDGRLDVVVANDSQPNFLYRNLGGGKFENAALEAGVAYDENARTRAGMGIDVADYANDGVPGIAIGNFSNEPVALYRRIGQGFFRDVTQRTGVAAETLLVLTFGVDFADCDLDGYEDLLLANGHLEPTIQRIQAEIPYEQPPMLLRNEMGRRFVNWGPVAGAPFRDPMVGRGLATGDLDGDGDLDVVVATNGGPLRLFRNDQDSGAHHLRVRLRGNAPNPEGIGARLVLHAGGLVQRRIVATGSSYLSQSDLVQTFGLGATTRVDRLEITWPDGSRTAMTDISPVDRLIEAEPD